jgi:hypothetical protein
LKGYVGKKRVLGGRESHVITTITIDVNDPVKPDDVERRRVFGAIGHDRFIEQPRQGVCLRKTRLRAEQG